jgi:hypothetical protein
MCVVAAPAHFGETILYHGRCHHPSHGRVHVLGYQNVAAGHAAGPNVMLLHLPGAGMTQGNLVDTSGSRRILTDMTLELGPPISVGYPGDRLPHGRGPGHRRPGARRPLGDPRHRRGTRPARDGEEWRTARMSWSEEVLRGPAGPFLPAAITGRTYTGVHPNGDFVIPYSDLTEGRMTAMRRVGPIG